MGDGDENKKNNYVAVVAARLSVFAVTDRQTEVAHLWKNRWQPEVGCVSALQQPVLENSD